MVIRSEPIVRSKARIEPLRRRDPARHVQVAGHEIALVQRVAQDQSHLDLAKIGHPARPSLRQVKAGIAGQGAGIGFVGEAGSLHIQAGAGRPVLIQR